MQTIKYLGELPWLTDGEEPVARAEWHFPSVSGNAELRVLFWKSPTAPRAILQIAHGMAEHIERYDAFARFAAAHDILVVGADHLGHGKSVADPSQLGFFAMEEGQNSVVNDMYALTRRVREVYPTAPYFLLGHSLGAMLAMLYATRYPNALTGLLLSGVSAGNPLAPMMKRQVEKHIQKYGLYSRTTKFGKLLDRMNNARIHPQRTDFDWLSTVDAEVDKYVRDPLCGFPFTAAGYRDLLACNIAVNSKRWLDSTPPFLPVHIFAGTDDPVCSYGKGALKLEAQLRRRRREVTCKLYPGARHEILNEFCREQVYADMVGAIYSHLGVKA